MSDFWSYWVIAISLGMVAGCWWLLRWTANMKDEGEQGNGHVWDDDLRELNNPLPRWWLWMFYGSMVFGLGYFVLYPALGNFSGLLNWSQVNEYNTEVAETNAATAPLFNRFAAMPIEDLSKNADALAIGQRLFINTCATCHGSDAKGAPGFPNLTDNDWLYGGTPNAITTSITDGRSGMMPPMAAALGPEGTEQVIAYVQSLSSGASDAKTEQGKTKFAIFCAACHGPDGRGNPALGSANLSDNIWLYGGTTEILRKTLEGGRNPHMPAHGEILGDKKIHLLAAYVYSLSHSQAAP